MKLTAEQRRTLGEVYATERERKRKVLEQSNREGLVEKACQTQY